MCPVNMYEFFYSKLNPACDKLWQKPRRGIIHYNDETWFEPRVMGHNPLEGFMKQLCKDAELSRDDYTNHSIRSTCISNLDKFGFEARHITAVSGHKSEATIREYSVKCPESKKREMYNALADSLTGPSPPKQKPTSTISNPEAATVTINVTSTTPKENIQNIKTEAFDLVALTDAEDDAILNKYLDENEAFLNSQLGLENTKPQTEHNKNKTNENQTQPNQTTNANTNANPNANTTEPEKNPKPKYNRT